MWRILFILLLFENAYLRQHRYLKLINRIWWIKLCKEVLLLEHVELFVAIGFWKVWSNMCSSCLFALGCWFDDCFYWFVDDLVTHGVVYWLNFQIDWESVSLYLSFYCHGTLNLLLIFIIWITYLELLLFNWFESITLNLLLWIVANKCSKSWTMAKLQVVEDAHLFLTILQQKLFNL